MKKNVKENIKRFIKNHFILWCIITTIINVIMVYGVYYLIMGQIKMNIRDFSIILVVMVFLGCINGGVANYIKSET